jgi:uncharacterized membrane protein
MAIATVFVIPSSIDMMLVMGPVVGIVSGLVLGLFCFVAAKIVKKTA